jgi:uncharacterized protein (TIGR03000 family)
MYGLVMMAALSTGGTAPASDFGYVGGGCGGVVVSSGCGGCGGVVVGGCGGGCYGGCGGVVVGGCGGGCYGGCGGRGVLFPRIRSLFSGSRGCGGCGGCISYGCGGCVSYGCGGCTGVSYGCVGSSCFGSSCHGSACYGFNSGVACYGAAPVMGVPMVSNVGGSVPHVVIGATPSMEFEAARAVPQAAPARLTIEVPADAKLFVDGHLTKTTGASRNFHTPDLKVGSSFFYDIKAEITVDGNTVVEEFRLVVKAGDTLTQSFPKLIAAAKGTPKNAVAAK